MGTMITKAFALAVVGGCVLAQPADVMALEDGDTVRIVVPYSAGGGYDAQARLAAPYIEEALRKNGLSNVNVIVENVTGGGGAIATSTVYEAEPDGTTILFLDPETSLWQQTLAGAPFDITEFTYIGQQSVDPLAFTVRSDLNLENFDQLKERSKSEPILLGTSGHGNYDHIFPMILSRMLEEQGEELRFDYLPLAGTGDILASMRRGEAEGTIEVYSTFLKLVEDGGARFLFTFIENDPIAENWPSAEEVLKLPEDKLELLSAAANFRRVYVAPPEVSDDDLSVLRTAFEEALSSGELTEKAKAGNRPIVFVDGESIQEIIEREAALAEQYGEYVKENL